MIRNNNPEHVDKERGAWNIDYIWLDNTSIFSLTNIQFAWLALSNELSKNAHTHAQETKIVALANQY